MPMPARYSTDQMLDAALRLFADGGLRAVTVAGVARHVGAPSGSVYHRFTGRDALVASVWLRTVERFQTGYLEALDDPNPVQGARRAVRHVVDWVRANPTEALLLLMHGSEELLGPQLDEELHDRQAALRDQLEQALRDFRQRLPAEVSRRRVRFALVDLPYAAVRPDLQARRRPPSEIDAILDETLDALLP